MGNTTQNPLNSGMFPFQGFNNFQLTQPMGAPPVVSEPLPGGKGQTPDLSGFNVGALTGPGGDGGKGGGGNLGGKMGGGGLQDGRQSLLASLPEGPTRQQRRRRRRRRRQRQEEPQAFQPLGQLISETRLANNPFLTQDRFGGGR